MPSVLEDYRKQKMTWDKSGRWTGQRVFTVALTKVDIANGVTLNESLALGSCPQPGNSHPQNSYLLVTSPSADRNSEFTQYTVTIPYEITPWVNPDTSGNPLNIPIRLRWEVSLETEQADRDKDGNPIVNSAGDPSTDPAKKYTPSIFLNILRNEYNYNVGLVNNVGSVNTSDWTIGSNLTIAAGCALCHSIAPDEDYYNGSLFVPILYRFEFRLDTFEQRIPDVGHRAFYASSSGTEKVSRIIDAQGNPVNIEIRLDGTGTLHSQSQTDGFDIEGRKPGGAFTGNGTPTGATVDTDSSYATFLKWNVQQQNDFNGFGF